MKVLGRGSGRFRPELDILLRPDTIVRLVRFPEFRDVTIAIHRLVIFR